MFTVPAALVLACAHAEPPPPSCDPVTEGAVSSARRLPPVLLYTNLEGGTVFTDGLGTQRPVGSGGAVVASLDVLEPTLRGWGWSGDFATMGPRPDGVYLVVWRSQSSIAWRTVDAVYVRPQETLVSIVPGYGRDNTMQQTVMPSTTTEVYVLLVPPGDYGPVGIVYHGWQRPRRRHELREDAAGGGE
jgi:hypothetical protein